MLILTQDRRAIIQLCDYDCIIAGESDTGKVYYRHNDIETLIGEYPSGYLARAVIMDIYNTFGLSPKYIMPTIGDAKRLAVPLL